MHSVRSATSCLSHPFSSGSSRSSRDSFVHKSVLRRSIQDFPSTNLTAVGRQVVPRSFLFLYDNARNFVSVSRKSAEAAGLTSCENGTLISVAPPNPSRFLRSDTKSTVRPFTAVFVLFRIVAINVTLGVLGNAFIRGSFCLVGPAATITLHDCTTTGAPSVPQAPRITIGMNHNLIIVRIKEPTPITRLALVCLTLDSRTKLYRLHTVKCSNA